MAKRGNSNNWVLAGARTSTGRPMLANDPHLLVEFPSVWYEMHLVAAGLDVIGVTIPGVPFVVIGHNRRIAWGFTNSGADVQDLTLERIDVARKRYLSGRRMAAGEGHARGHPGSRACAPEAFDVWETRERHDLQRARPRLGGAAGLDVARRGRGAVGHRCRPTRCTGPASTATPRPASSV